MYLKIKKGIKISGFPSQCIKRIKDILYLYLLSFMSYGKYLKNLKIQSKNNEARSPPGPADFGVCRSVDAVATCRIIHKLLGAHTAQGVIKF